jgi:hypothetical protein
MRGQGTPTREDSYLWQHQEAAAIAKYLQPGDALMAIAAHRLLAEAMTTTIQEDGILDHTAAPLLKGLWEFLDAEGYSINRGEYLTDAERTARIGKEG